MSAISIIYLLIVFLALIVVPGVVTLLKGQRLIFIVGLILGGMVWIVSAFRLARPTSWWARRFYPDQKLVRAVRRYG